MTIIGPCAVYTLYGDGRPITDWVGGYDQELDQYSTHDRGDGWVKQRCGRSGRRTPHGEVLCPEHYTEMYAWLSRQPARQKEPAWPG